jgi:hypothetical protein
MSSPQANVDHSSSDLTIRDAIQDLTKGRPFIFMIMSFDTEWDLFERVRKICDSEFKVACLRADDVKSSGHDLLAKIHFLISRSEVVIAEISKRTENVFYEIGYAVGIQKSPILLIKKGEIVPADLRGLEVIEYSLDKQGVHSFEKELTDHLRVRLNTELALLRDMLEASSPKPCYIVTSPKYPGSHSRILGQVYDKRTFGDHLGIMGLITAFGSMWGESKGVELISAQHSPPDLPNFEANLYLIGSRKVNPIAGQMLEQLQPSKESQWSFDPSPGCPEKEVDWSVSLYQIASDARKHIHGKAEELGPKKEWVWTSDFGLIVRGPHPHHPGRMVLVLAGAHSLGTGAACLAATRSSLIRRIRSKLPPGVLENKNSTFWALVKGTANRQDFLLDEEGVTIEDVGEIK